MGAGRVFIASVLTLMMLGGLVGSCVLAMESQDPAPVTVLCLLLAVVSFLCICALEIAGQLGKILAEMRKWSDVGKVEERKDGKG
jgi:hypothetical protein